MGQKVTGTVRSIAPFGVFIDLGGIDGLVHKSELSWNKVNNPEAGYRVGEEVEAEVIDINHERGRISLSIRRLQPDPWHSTVADLKVGDIIDGTVTKIVNFGAFVRVRDGLEGLIHISELSHARVAHPGDVVHEGQTLKLKIISLEQERHRLGLSLKQAEEAPARPERPQPRRVGERRPQRGRGYDMSQAVQEPEGGIDNTLAAAFAQVRAADGGDRGGSRGPRRTRAETPPRKADRRRGRGVDDRCRAPRLPLKRPSAEVRRPRPPPSRARRRAEEPTAEAAATAEPEAAAAERSRRRGPALRPPRAGGTSREEPRRKRLRPRRRPAEGSRAKARPPPRGRRKRPMPETRSRSCRSGRRGRRPHRRRPVRSRPRALTTPRRRRRRQGRIGELRPAPDRVIGRKIRPSTGRTDRGALRRRRRLAFL